MIRFDEPLTHRAVLAIALPIMASNVTEPLLGLVNTAVIGQLPEAYYIGAIASGALLFAFLFWGFGFLRLSTSGLAAQATGAGDKNELAAVVLRALGLALVIGISLVLLSPLIGQPVIKLIGGSADVQQQALVYFNWRIWSAPFAMCNFCIMGWFIGQGQSRIAFITQLALNLVNILLSCVLVLVWDMKTAGVGMASLLAEGTGTAVGGYFLLKALRRLQPHITGALLFNGQKLRQTLQSNADIMIRTVCLVYAFAWFTRQGAAQGDVIMAGNAILLNFYEMAAYMIDGFAYAAEALVGQAVGAGLRDKLRQAITLTSLWAMGLGLLCGLIIWVTGPWAIAAMTTSPQVQAAALAALPWVSLATMLGAACFQLDGIYTGLLATRDMRNMMLLTLVLFLGICTPLAQNFGNSGLWAALVLFLAARGFFFASRLPAALHVTLIQKSCQK